MNRKEHSLPDDSHKHLRNMKKTLLKLAFLSLLAFVATGCSSDEEYNADTAISYYKPLEYDKMVSSIEIAYKKGNKLLEKKKLECISTTQIGKFMDIQFYI